MSWSSNSKSNSRTSEQNNSLNESTISYKSSISSLTTSNHLLPPLNSTSGSSTLSRANSAKYENKNASKLNIGSEDIVKKLEVRLSSILIQ